MSHHSSGGGGGNQGRPDDRDPRHRAPLGPSRPGPPNYGTLTQPGQQQQQQQQQQQDCGPPQQQQFYPPQPGGGSTYPAPWEQGVTSPAILPSRYSRGDRDGGQKRRHTSRSDSNDSPRSSNSGKHSDSRRRAKNLDTLWRGANLIAEGWDVIISPETFSQPTEVQDHRPSRTGQSPQPGYEQQPPDPQGYGQPPSSQRRVGPPISQYGQSGVPSPSQMYESLSEYDYGDRASAASDYTMQRPTSLQRSDMIPMLPPQIPMQSGLDRSNMYPSYQPFEPAGTNNFEFYGGVPQTGPSLDMSSGLPPPVNPSHGYQPPLSYQNPPPFQTPSPYLQQAPSQQQGPQQQQVLSQKQVHGGAAPGRIQPTTLPQPFCTQPSCQHLPVFRAKLALAEHMLMAHPNVKSNCRHCDNDFNEERQLLKHKRDANHGPGYYCRGTNCAYGSATKQLHGWQGWQTTAPRVVHLRSLHKFCTVRGCGMWKSSFDSNRQRIRHMETAHGWDPQTVVAKLASETP